MIVNFVLFQIGWFACVLGAANGWTWLGPVVAVPILIVAFATVPDRGALILLTLAVAGAGVFCDGCLAFAGVLGFDADPLALGPLPLWMAALWAMFATTLDVSLRWLQRRLVLAAVLGAIAGPLAYAGAERLGGVRLAEGAHLWLALEWAVLMVYGTWLARSLRVSVTVGLEVKP